MNLPGLINQLLAAQQTWNNPQLEQLSLLLAAGSRMPISTLSLNPTGTLRIPAQLPFGENTSGITKCSAGNNAPDGKSSIRYPEPDPNTFVYDPTLGYKFDQSTGLHYDANSGLFINKKLEILLRYDEPTNTYKRAGSTADITAPVLAGYLAKLMGYDTNHLVDLEKHQYIGMVQSAAHRQDSSEVPPSTPSSQIHPSLGVPHVLPQIGEQRRNSSKDDTSTYSITPGSPQWQPTISEMELEGTNPLKPSHKESRRSRSPQEGRSIRLNYERERKRNMSKSQSRSSISPPGKVRLRDLSKIEEMQNGDDDSFEETLRSIARIHERNLKKSDNTLARLLPPTYTFTQESHMVRIMVTPLPPKGNREWKDLEILFGGILSANSVPYNTVSVQPQNGNSPCDYALVCFKTPEDAARWYLLHEGALDLANPDGSKRTAYMYFSKAPWKCGFCKESNFPFRGFCYACFRPKEMLSPFCSVPIVEAAGGSTCVAIKKLDFQITSTEEVLDCLRPLGIDSFGIKTCEFITEENGLPLGLCAFEMTDKVRAQEFFKFLRKRNFKPFFLFIHSRKGLSHNPYPLGKLGSNRLTKADKNSATFFLHKCTQTTLTNATNLGDYILRNYPVGTEIPDVKSTQTVLIYKNL